MEYKCPKCGSVIYSRKNLHCGVCSERLPAELLFSPEQRAAVEKDLADLRERRGQDDLSSDPFGVRLRKHTEDLTSPPSGGRIKMWFFGAVVAFIPIGYGSRCLFTGQTYLFARHSHRPFEGASAIGLAVAYIALGLFFHAHWFWGLNPKLQRLSPVLKLTFALLFFGAFAYAIYTRYTSS